jgi:hypothetical protein
MIFLRCFIKIVFICLAIVCNLFNSLPVLADSASLRTVEVKGEGDSVRAAREDAFRNAVEQVRGVFVNADTVTRDYSVVVDRILARSEAFISHYDVLESSQHADGHVSTRIRVTVNLGAIKDDAEAFQILRDRLGNPRFMVVGVSQSSGRRGDDEATAAAVGAVNRFLTSKQIEVVDEAQIESLKDDDASLGMTESLAQKIARKLNASVYVTVYGHVERSASVNVKFFESSTGRLLGEDSGYSRSTEGYLADQKQAVVSAVTDACQRAFTTMLAYWKRDSSVGVPITVILKGLPLSKKATFRRILTEMGREVRQINATSGYAEFAVTLEPGQQIDAFQEAVIEKSGQSGLNLDDDATVVRGNRLLFTFK